MKMFIQYLDYNLAGVIDEVCGDRGVIIVDGRCSLQTAKLIARENNAVRRPCYLGFAIHQIYQLKFSF